MNYTSRDQIDGKYKWKLEDMVASNDFWQREYDDVLAQIPSLPGLSEGMLSSAEALLAALERIDGIEERVSRLFTYARMRRDENNADSFYVGLTARANTLIVEFSKATSFLSPLLSSAPDGLLEKYIAENARLAEKYDFLLRETLRAKAHILSPECEELLSASHDFSGGAQEVFTMLDNVDIDYGKVRDGDGEKIKLTHGQYMVLLQSDKRSVRRAAYRSYYRGYRSMIHAISAAYATSVKADIFYARARKHGSALLAALYGDNVPKEVYTGLISEVHNNLGAMYRYLALRKKLLGVRELKMYDVYTPLVAGVKNSYTYEEGCEMVLRAVAPLGEDYVAAVKKGMSSGWIDVYETPGKTSGAYSWSMYGTHPYVLLNHREDLGSVYTLAHELGHAMHSYYSMAAQPYSKADYKIFVAEVASTVNEILLTKYLLKNEKDADVRKYVLNHYLDQFRTTVFRQTMFAEFEMKAHELAEEGSPLTPESLSDVYLKLNTLYYGPQMHQDDDIACEWARIPHFYRAFYVYKYATGFSCAVQIATDILREGEEAAKRYRAFLSGGGSDHPLELLKLANVDLATGGPVRAAMEAFSAALDDFTKLMEV